MQKEAAAKRKKGNSALMIGIVLIILGAGFYIFNYERQSVSVGGLNVETQIIDYYAPLWDPFPHHLRVNVEASEDIVVKKVMDRDTSTIETLSLKSDETTFHIYPGETIEVYLENRGAAQGRVKTVLWCDSWNYAAAVLLVLGLVLLRF